MRSGSKALRSRYKDASKQHGNNELRYFMGLVEYYAKIVKEFAEKSKPLREVLRNGKSFVWLCEQERVFEKINKYIASAKILTTFDVKKRTSITVAQVL
ncbi:hypothetical protein NDU88_004636 [Pleurodeles waltl]|uniref:Uncharacterized protein n=1 Tax=Pleurodeles waltl TaxID=8319 RepID=A0AAV7UJM9_PLEWA|nr:hypothetical protein NDU88_004636 [Pleurodeles waltl]